MLDNKFLFTLMGLLLAMLAICKVSNNDNQISENFGMLPSRTTRVSHSALASDGTHFAVPANYASTARFDFGSGAAVSYDLPAEEHRAASCEPMTFGRMARENYTKENYGCSSCKGGCKPTCKNPQPYMSKPVADASYSGGDYDQVLDSINGMEGEVSTNTSLLPAATMTTLGIDGVEDQVQIYSHAIYANRNSRTRGQGDPIRGDLPIVPCQADWFRPSANPSVDLQQGAMMVLAGQNNDVTNSMAQLMNTSGALNTTAGVDLSTTTNLESSAFGADLTVTGYL